MCASAVLLAASGLAVPVAAATTVVAPDTLEAVPGPGVALHVPVDGRVNGDGFTLDVTGYRFASQVGLGQSEKVAGPGQALLVFGVTGSGSSSSLSTNLMVDGQGEALPNVNVGPSTPAYFLASVPAGARDVAFEASADGFSQAFSFTKGRREGPQPAVLYASQGNWEQVDQLGQVSYVGTPDKVDGLMYGRVEVTLASLTRTYFLPGTSATPGDPSKAWLVLSGSAMPNLAPDDPGGESAFTLEFLKTLPGTDLTLTLPHAKPLAAMLTGQGGADDESGQNAGWGLFGGDYYWEVPAGLQGATLTVHLPADLLAQSSYVGSPLEVPVQGSVPPVQVAFAPGYKAPAVAGPNPPPWAPKPAVSATPTTSGGPHTRLATSSPKLVARAARASSGAPVFVGVVVVLLVALMSAGYYYLRRRRLVPSLAALTATPAEKRAASVEAWLPSPAGPGAGTAHVGLAGPGRAR